MKLEPKKCDLCNEIPKITKNGTAYSFSCSCGPTRTFIHVGMPSKKSAIEQYNRNWKTNRNIKKDFWIEIAADRNKKGILENLSVSCNDTETYKKIRDYVFKALKEFAQ